MREDIALDRERRSLTRGSPQSDQLIEGAEEYLFGDITELAVAPDGSIYVFDRQVPALRKYDAKGKFVRTFGRKGQGHGEYLSGGVLAVLDPRLRTKGYGARFLRSLPPAPVVHELAEVEAFFSIV